ncbi:MAG: hypothetical protein QOH06_2219 [Acidobacteriota bacterium]|jgi:hypothetical protein|nr:hypothetical protein [Acidobacteriota bacterium]
METVMSRHPIAFLLLALGTAAMPTAAQGPGNPLLRCPKEARRADPGETVVGEVITLNPRLLGQRLGGSREPMSKCSQVVKQMKVNSEEEAGAWIAVNPGDRGRKGFVILGPETEVEFSDFVVHAATGDPDKMEWTMQLGQFRVALAPVSGELGKGEYLIRVPATATRKAVEIRMAGTDVYVAADDRSTTVAVFEGLVTVESAGRTVALAAGTWTRTAADGAPSAPMAIGPGPEALSPSVLGPVFTVPNEAIDLVLVNDPRLNLPK